MTSVYFLEADVPLVKSYTLSADGKIESQNYPHAKYFTSHHVRCATLVDLFKAIKEHAAKGHCLLKGKLRHDLVNQERAGMTTAEDSTEWICLDLDKAPFKTPAEFMDHHPLLKDVSYVVQYSASQGLPKAKGLSCHIFMLLTHPYHAKYIKAWLMQQNLDGNIMNGQIRKGISLTATASALHYPIDITACQNDKLLFIAKPKLGKGVTYTLTDSELIQLVKKPLDRLPIERLQCSYSYEALKKQANELRNALRREAGLDPIKTKSKMIEGFEVQTGVGEFVITGVREARGFRYFNFNGGDSWAYFHPLDNFEYIHSFKDGGVSYKTKEVLPDYYKQCQAELRRNATTPNEDGDLILAICDKRSGSYHKIAWNAEKKDLRMYPANTKDQLHDWLMSHDKRVPDFIEQYDVDFNPQSDVIIDVDAKYLNTYVPSPWFRAERTPNPAGLEKAPTIKRVLMSLISHNRWTDTTEHFVNWLATIFQYRIKTQTAWVFSGVEGTGKGTLVNHILTPLLGANYVQALDMSVLEDDYNEYLERALIISFDEVQISALNSKGKVASKLRNWITEPRVKIRKMRVSPYTALNYTNFLLSSNKDDPVIINNEDRRYNIAEFQTEKLLLSRADIYQKIPAELPHFFDYLIAYDANIEQAKTIIATQTRKAVIAANRNSLDMLADAILDGDLSPFIDALPDMRLITEIHNTGNASAIAVQYNTIITRELNKLCQAKPKNGLYSVESHLTRDELWVLFEHAIGNIPVSPHKFTRLLRHKRLETQRIRQNDKLFYGIKVKWVASKEWVDEHTIDSSVSLKVVNGGKK